MAPERRDRARAYGPGLGGDDRSRETARRGAVAGRRQRGGRPGGATPREARPRGYGRAQRPYPRHGLDRVGGPRPKRSSRHRRGRGPPVPLRLRRCHMPIRRHVLHRPAARDGRDPLEPRALRARGLRGVGGTGAQPVLRRGRGRGAGGRAGRAGSRARRSASLSLRARGEARFAPALEGLDRHRRRGSALRSSGADLATGVLGFHAVDERGSREAGRGAARRGAGRSALRRGAPDRPYFPQGTCRFPAEARIVSACRPAAG